MCVMYLPYPSLAALCPGNLCGIRILAKKNARWKCLMRQQDMFATLKIVEGICWRKFHNFWIYIYVFWKSDVWNIMESQPLDSIRSSGPCSSQMPGSCRHASPCPLLSLADMAVIQNSPCSTAVVRSKNIYFPYTPPKSNVELHAIPEVS